MVTRVRQNRSEKVDTSVMDDLMKSIANSQDEVAKLGIKITADLAALHKLMGAAKTKFHQVENIVAEVYCPAGRATNVIDPKKFKKAVSEKDFWESVTVGVTKAKALLPDKVVAGMTKTIPGKVGDETIRVQRRGS